MSLEVDSRDNWARRLRSISLVAAAALSSPAEARGFALAVRAIGEATGVNVTCEPVIIEQEAHPWRSTLHNRLAAIVEDCFSLQAYGRV